MEHTHTNKIVYIAMGVVAIIILVMVLKYVIGQRHGASPPEMSLEEQMTATGPSTLTPEEEARLREQMTATGPSTISEADMVKLRESMRAQN